MKRTNHTNLSNQILTTNFHADIVSKIKKDSNNENGYGFIPIRIYVSFSFKMSKKYTSTFCSFKETMQIFQIHHEFSRRYCVKKIKQWNMNMGSQEILDQLENC